LTSDRAPVFWERNIYDPWHTCKHHQQTGPDKHLVFWGYHLYRYCTVSRTRRNLEAPCLHTTSPRYIAPAGTVQKFSHCRGNDVATDLFPSKGCCTDACLHSWYCSRCTCHNVVSISAVNTCRYVWGYRRFWRNILMPIRDEMCRTVVSNLFFVCVPPEVISLHLCAPEVMVYNSNYTPSIIEI
jgi:hypothetical protein